MATSIMDATLATPAVLVSTQLAASETTQYGPVPASKWLTKIAATITNTSGSAVTVSVSLVKSGGTAGASNRVLSAFSLAPGDSAVLSELAGHSLGPGDFISTLAGTGSAVAFVLSGVLFS